MAALPKATTRDKPLIPPESAFPVNMARGINHLAVCSDAVPVIHPANTVAGAFIHFSRRLGQRGVRHIALCRPGRDDDPVAGRQGGSDKHQPYFL